MCHATKTTLPWHTRNPRPIVQILFGLCKGVEVRDPSVIIVFPCQVISGVFVRIELSITWPNRLLALLGIIDESVLRGIPPSQ